MATKTSPSAPIDDVDRDQGSALARGLMLLDCFRSPDRFLSVQDLVDRSGLPKATVSRLAHTLVSTGYLEYAEAQSRFYLGARVISLGFSVLGALRIRQVARPLMRELAASPRWAGALGGVLRHHDAVAEPSEYAALLLDAGLSVDVWESTYLHLLSGPDPVLEWLRGTGLRPVLGALSPEDATEFETSFAVLLRQAYPPTPHGTLLPYRRIFAVGHRPS